MEYTIKAKSTANNDASFTIKQSVVNFGTTPEAEDTLANPAELFLGSLSACILKNVERFSHFMKYDYSRAEIVVNAVRLDHPPRMADIHYELIIFSTDTKLNINLLKKNIEKFGTIYNTIQTSCTITGEIKRIHE